MSTESYWIWHGTGFWSRGRSQIVEKYNQRIVAERSDALETFDNLDIEKSLEKSHWGLGAADKGKGKAVIRARLEMHTED